MVAVMAAVILDADAQGEVINGDTTMTGIVQDKMFDIYGNLTVPGGGTLVLRNVTIVFHDPMGYAVGLRASRGSTLRILDGDDDPLTTGDGSFINSTPDPGVITVDKANVFEVRNSVLEHMGRDNDDPSLGDLSGPWIDASSVGLHNATLFGVQTTWTMMGDTLTIADSQIYGSESYIIVESDKVQLVDSLFEVRQFYHTFGDRFEMDRCFVNASVIACSGVVTVIARNTTFNSSIFSFHGGVVGGSVLDCTFSGDLDHYAIYANATTSIINDCVFNGPIRGVQINSDTTAVDGCTFLGSDIGVYYSSGTLSLINGTFDSCRNGVVLDNRNSRTDIDLTGLAFINCSVSLKAERWEGAISLASCEFRDSQGVSIVTTDFGRLSLDGCSFINVTTGIQAVPNQGDEWWLRVTNSTFRMFSQGILCSGGNISVVGSSFDAMGFPSAFTKCILVSRHQNKGRYHLEVEDCDFANASTAININPNPLSTIHATIIRNRIRRCDIGIEVGNLTSLHLEDLTISDCGVGARVDLVDYVEVYDIHIDNGTDGLILAVCSHVDIGLLFLRDLTGWSVIERAINSGYWNISQDITYRGAKFQLEGSFSVNASLTLIDVELFLQEPIYTGPGFQVLGGGTLTLVGSTLSGYDYRPFSLRIVDGGTLSAVNSTIAYCGRSDDSLDATGPYIRGGVHHLSGLRLEHCHNGLILVNCQVFADGMEVLGGSTGAHISRSDVTVLNSTLLGDIYGVFASDSILTFRNCSIDSSLIGLSMENSQSSLINSSVVAFSKPFSLEGSTLYIEASNISTEGDLVGLIASDLVLWNCSISPLRVYGGTVDTSTLSLYDTMHEGQWMVTGTAGMVEYHWSHRILVLHHWDRSPAVGRLLEVFGAMDTIRPVASEVVNTDGLLGFWLTGRRIDNAGEGHLGPYEFIIEVEGVHGQVTSPGDGPWKGTLEIFDVESPTVEILEPVHNSIWAVSTIGIAGSVRDVGSGVDVLELSFDGQRWTPLSFNDGAWKHEVLALDGRHTLRVRVSDMEGNTGEGYVTFVVDTTPPLVVFAGPPPDTPFVERNVVLTGFTVIDEGTAIFQVRVEGQLVILDAEGRFSLNVTFSHEGENTFTVEAVDLAGNRATDRITLFLDLTPPVLEFENIPTVTNVQDLVVNGSVVDDTRVSITLGGSLIATLSNGTFTTTVILSLGENHLLFEATDMVGNRVEASYTVVLDATVNGTIISPHHGERVTNGWVTVAVDTDPFTWVRIRGHSFWEGSGANGTLTQSILLETTGEYELIVEFRDQANNTLMQGILIVLVEEGPEEAYVPGWLWWALPSAIIIGVASYLIVRDRRSHDPDE